MLERRLVVSGARYFSWLAVRDEIRRSPDTPNSRLSAPRERRARYLRTA